jgi:polyhydroxybutyrate depolymerase
MSMRAVETLSYACVLLTAVACSSGEEPGGAAGASGSAGQGKGGAANGGAANGGAANGGAANGGAASGNGPQAGTSTGGAGANAGGSSGAGAGSGGGSGGGGSGGATQGSLGCGMAAGQALNQWVEQPKLAVAGIDRQWWVWLPTGYDPMKPYPVVFNFHGCSSSDNIVPMQKVTGDKAILVRATGISDNVCWDAAAGGNDVKFFDQMLAEVLAKRCADATRVFATGYSSGSWLSNTLACERGDKLRGIGTVSGGTFGNKTNCKGKFARIFVHDADDLDNEITDGNDDERDRLVLANHCMASAPVMEAPAPCARYQGCDPGFPVIWCQTEGQGHARQDSLAPGAFWGLFSSL